jgi:hypothetical protein
VNERSETERKERKKKNKAKDNVYNSTKLVAHPTITTYVLTYTELDDRC